MFKTAIGLLLNSSIMEELSAKCQGSRVRPENCRSENIRSRRHRTNFVPRRTVDRIASDCRAAGEQWSPAAPTFAPTAQRKSRQDRDGFGKRFTNGALAGHEPRWRRVV